MADIFLSYAHADVVDTDRVAAALRGLGWSVWQDEELNAGDNWSSTIEAEVQQARCVVVLWSATSMQREWVLKEATMGLERARLIPMMLDRGLQPPAGFGMWQAGSLATWDGTPWHPAFQKLVRALKPHLGEPPRPIPPHPPYPLYASEILREDRPASVAELSLPRRAQYFSSPADWKDEVLYLLIPDRFSDGREKERPALDRDALHGGDPARAGSVPFDQWAISGEGRWQGGTLAGVTSKLEYLQGLGVTTVWLWPVLKQRMAADTFHGYAPQDFLDVDPHLGTRHDLVELVTLAHHRQMRVILSGELHHSGANWIYGASVGNPMMPAYTRTRHPFGAWLGANGHPVLQPQARDDAVWPSELRDPDCYLRAGTGRLGPTEDDGENPEAEFRRSDFYSLRTFDPYRTLGALIECHRYWLALTDCDGFYLDLAAHEPPDVLRAFCGGIRQYAARLGKQNFLMLGEVFGSTRALEKQYSLMGRTLHRSLSAILDNGSMRLKLQNVAKGLLPASEWFAGYDESDGELGMHRALGSRHVSILDDPDGVFGQKLRFACDGQEHQIVVALALQLFSLGIPCIYYGTEQALGQRPVPGRPLPPEWGTKDVFLREAMFGPEHPRRAGHTEIVKQPSPVDPELPGFGPLGTAGRHAFDDARPLYQKIAGLIATRRNHAALRTGSQYQREISTLYRPFELPRATELVAWSRILDDEEVVCVVNPNAFAERGGWVTVDSTRNHEGAVLRVVFATGAIEVAAAGPYRAGTAVQVLREGGRAYLDIRGIPPGGVVVLSNQAE